MAWTSHNCMPVFMLARKHDQGIAIFEGIFHKKRQNRKLKWSLSFGTRNCGHERRGRRVGIGWDGEWVGEIVFGHWEPILTSRKEWKENPLSLESRCLKARKGLVKGWWRHSLAFHWNGGLRMWHKPYGQVTCWSATGTTNQLYKLANDYVVRLDSFSNEVLYST